MNQLVTTSSSGAVMLPSDALALMNFCRELSTARTIPPAFQKSPADCFLVLSICQRYGFDFLPTIWECSIIRNRLFFSGKMTAAMLNASGQLAEKLNYEYESHGDELAVIVSARLVGETVGRLVRVALKSVRTENENWKRNPEQQLAYAGARVWGRRHVPEVLLGLMFEGETIDVTPNPPPPPPIIPAPSSEPPPVAEPPKTEHTKPFKLGPPTEEDGWRPWAQDLIKYVRASQSLEEIEQWLSLNDQYLLNLREEETRMWRMLDSAIQQQRVSHGAEQAEADSESTA